jgi:hypothetical protein
MLRWRLWWGLNESEFAGSLGSGGRFCVGAFERTLAGFNHHEDIFTFNSFYKEIFINVALEVRFATIILQ